MRRIGIDPTPRFELGETVITHGIAASLGTISIRLAMARHASGDWGEMEAEDRQRNNEALQCGGRLFSIFRTAAGIKFYIITEADRSRTTVLLPEEY